jgi:hypothetical protein
MGLSREKCSFGLKWEPTTQNGRLKNGKPRHGLSKVVESGWQESTGVAYGRGPRDLCSSFLWRRSR